MNGLKLKKQKGAGAKFVLPDAFVEIEPGFVLAARLDRSRNHVRRLGMRRLDDAAIEPLLARPNILKPEAARATISELMEVTGCGGGTLGMIIPDAAVRLSTVSLDALPDHASEAAALIAWRLKDALPFSPEEARLSHQVMERKASSADFLALAGRETVLVEYEALTESLNVTTVLLTPSTVPLLALLPEGAGAQMLQHACGGGLTTVLLDDARIHLWRHIRLEGSSSEDREGAIAAEAARVLASARDHLLLEVRRAWVCARPGFETLDLDALSRALECPFATLAADPSRAAASLAPDEMRLFSEYAAPIAGALENRP